MVITSHIESALVDGRFGDIAPQLDAEELEVRATQGRLLHDLFAPS